MTKMHLKLLSINAIVLFFFSTAGVWAQSEFTYEKETPPTMEMLLNAREEFRYKVTYGFLTLGWIDVRLLPDTTYNGKEVYHLQTVMQTNNRILFVGTHIVSYENLFQYNDQWPYSFVFWRDDIHKKRYNEARIVFDRDSGTVQFYENDEHTKTLDLIEPASGGDIIFYYSRMFAGLEEPYRLPVYIGDEVGYVQASSSRETEMRKYEAFDEPIETYMSEGLADVEGPFGFRGRFKSWFSTSDLRVPVEAHVKVIFGNVKVKLISYEQTGSD